MADALSYAAAALVMTIAVGRLIGILPSAPTPAQWHLLLVLGAVACALALAAPTTLAAAAGLEPVPRMTTLVSNVFAMFAASNSVAMVAHVVDGPDVALKRTRCCAWALALTITVMTVLLFSAKDVDSGADFARASASASPLMIYQVIFLGYLGCCTSRFIVLMRHYLSRPDARRLIRWGVLLAIQAAVVGLVWLAWNGLTVVTDRVGIQLVPNPAEVSQALGAIASALLAVGVTLPSLGNWLWGTARAARTRWLLRRLTPFWQLLATTVPAVMFRGISLGEPSRILYRRIIEIRDAQLFLMDYAPAELSETPQAPGSPRRRRRFLIRSEARALDAALHRYYSGSVAAPPRPTSSMSMQVDSHQSESDVLGEARWLVLVYSAMHVRRVDCLRPSPGSGELPRMLCQRAVR